MGAANAAAVATAKELTVMAYPNPGTGTTPFSIRTQSNILTERVSIKVFDALGRMIDAKQSVQPNSTTSVGGNYLPGIYLIQVSQGGKTVTLKLMKK